MSVEIIFVNQSNNADNSKVEIFSKDQPEDPGTDSTSNTSTDTAENENTGEADQK